MASQFYVDRRVEDVAVAYVAARRRSQYLSIGLAIRAIRTLIPNCSATDRDLANMVAAAAVDRAMAVSFDGSVAEEQIGRSGEAEARA